MQKADENYQPIQALGVDQSVDYASLSKFGPWDDRNYQLTAEDLRILPDNHRYVPGVPAFFKVMQRKEMAEQGFPLETHLYPREFNKEYQYRFGGLLQGGKLFLTERGKNHYKGPENASAPAAPARWATDPVEKNAKAANVLAEGPFDGTLSDNETTIEYHPTNPDIVIAGSNGTGGQRMSYSSNGGVTWSSAGALPGTCCDPAIEFSPDGSIAFAATLAIKSADIKVLEYSHSAGNESYRKKLCNYYKGYNINIEPSEVIITNGGSEAISIAMMTCFNPGMKLSIPEPFYANYNGFSVAANVTVKPIKSSIESGFALPPISDFEKLITPKTKGIMICNPGNPTGYLYTKAELEALKDLVKKYDLFLLSDEVYREFCYDGKEYVSVMHLSGIENNVILLDSISKRYSACGARIGAMISKNKEVMSAALKFAQTRLSPPTFGQIASEAALDVSA